VQKLRATEQVLERFAHNSKAFFSAPAKLFSHAHPGPFGP